MTMHQYLKSLPKTKWCKKCGCMVNKWHEHFGRKSIDRVSYPKGFEK